MSFTTYVHPITTTDLLHLFTGWLTTTSLVGTDHNNCTMTRKDDLFTAASNAHGVGSTDDNSELTRTTGRSRLSTRRDDDHGHSTSHRCSEYAEDDDINGKAG
jgi:hypothetical protein